jgi:hypothetical protein
MGDAMFGRKRDLDSLWQEIALNFFPERADFTYARSEGEEYSDHLFASYPVMARRELGNLLAANLRPRDRKWFSVHVDDEGLDESDAERAYLEHITNIQWRAMYDRNTGFVRATKETDHDFATFGNGVIKFGPNITRTGLLFKNYHLRDCAWSENAEGRIDVLHRNWKPSARQLKHHFQDKVSREVMKACEKDPEKTFACRHVVLPSRLYHYRSKGGKEYPFISLYVECASETVLEEVGLNYFCYVVPRWQTISGSPYGVSMATGILLPDGRTLQVMMRTLREAGEKYVDPPMLAVGDAIRGDIALYAGGVTTADIEYDERLGEVLRPITRDRGGFPIGMELASALKEDIRAGMLLDKIQLPETSKDMTAFEVGRRLQESVKAQSPIFEPVIEDYNDPLCDGIFTVLSDEGAFPIEGMPESLQGRDIQFKFRSPLADLAEQNEAETYMDIMGRIVGPAAQIDPSQMENVELTEATRDAMRAAGWKAKWFKPREAVEEKRAADAQEAEAMKSMAAADQVSQIAGQGGKAMESLVKAGAQAQAAPAA